MRRSREVISCGCMGLRGTLADAGLEKSGYNEKVERVDLDTIEA